MAEFEGYKDRKGFWFWMMLTTGTFISTDPSLSATKTDILVEDFLQSEFFTWVFKNRPAPIKFFKSMR